MRLEIFLSRIGLIVTSTALVVWQIHVLYCVLDGIIPDRDLCEAASVWFTAGTLLMRMAQKMRRERLQAMLDELLFKLDPQEAR